MIGTSIKILQINLNRSAPATESALQLAVENRINIVLVQEPWLIPGPNYTNTRSVNHAGFTQILPKNKENRPRTLIYIAKDFKPSISVASSSPDDSDLIVLNITEENSQLQILNIYNESDQSQQGPKTLPRVVYNRELEQDTVLAGDFNLHHPWWDPLAPTSPGAEDLVDWADSSNLELLNIPGTGTFFRPNLSRESIIDLTFATASIAGRIQDWVVLPDLGSDHYGISFTIQGTDQELVDSPLQEASYNTDLADWDLFASKLKASIASNRLLYGNTALTSLVNPNSSWSILEEKDQEQVSNYLDLIATEFTKAIVQAADLSIPRRKLGARAKPWWSDDLKELRKDMMRNQRSYICTKTEESKRSYLAAKNQYFLAIKVAKRNHWNQFLEKEDPRSIFQAMKYTKDSQVERIPDIQSTGNPEVLADSFGSKCASFRSALFPTPPTAPKPSWLDYRPATWNWPELSSEELGNACLGDIKGKTPGPDLITHPIIQQAYKAIPEVFFAIYSALINVGYHPAPWKQATGAILKKPGKPDYSVPKAYRVISLLNCLGKVSERILAKRLSFLAETTTLLHPSQIGGRLKKSAIDAALLLNNEVELNKQHGLKTSALFLDVKGAFDHVAKNQLLAILQKLKLPISLITWVSSFLSKRLLRLRFDGQTEPFSQINTGIPQGSPISPILFLIYIRDLFTTTSTSVLSYIDDIALIASSPSFKKNTTILEREAAKLYALGAASAVEFDLDKTDLIHFSPSAKSKLKLPNGDLVAPKQLVRWLGVWFDSKLTYKQHVQIRVAQAKSAFHRMARLANTERGLSPLAMRQLYMACVTSIADYGSVIWWRGQEQFKKSLQALQNIALRKILGVFKSTPIIPMEVEAALPPPHTRLSTAIRNYSVRMAKLSKNHPINVELSKLNDNNPHSEGEPGPPTGRIRQLQLSRIHNSTSDLVDVQSLEKLQHYHFPPWVQIPYGITISSLSKEDEATAHKIAVSQTQLNTVNIYTDASHMATPESNGVGVGFAAFAGNCQSVQRQNTSNIGTEQLVYDGELEGITQAIEYASSIAQPDKLYRIHADNQAALLRLRKLSDNPGQACQIRSIEAAKLAQLKGASIELNWVPGHMDIQGNELADALAKEATTLEPWPNETSFAYLGMEARKQQRQEWLSYLESYSREPTHRPASYAKRFQWKLNSKLRIPPGTKRELASSFYQLKFGHGYIRSYLYRLGHAENSNCRCGSAETTEHLLLSCKLFKEERRELQKQINSRLSLSLLLHSTIGIAHTLSFLDKTKIVTRKWHLARGEEEEEDEAEGQLAGQLAGQLEGQFAELYEEQSEG